MRRPRPLALLVVAAVFAGCSWLARNSDDSTPEKLYADEPCATECCCKTKRGYYSYFRCLERPDCDRQGGSCERADLARCAGAEE